MLGWTEKGVGERGKQREEQRKMREKRKMKGIRFLKNENQCLAYFDCLLRFEAFKNLVTPSSVIKITPDFSPVVYLKETMSNHHATRENGNTH